MGIAELKVLLRRRFSYTKTCQSWSSSLFSWCSWSSFPAATPRLLRNAVLTIVGSLAPQDRSAKTRKCCAHLNLQKEKTTNAVRVIRALKEKGKMSTQRARKMVPEFFFQRLLSFSCVYFSWLDQHVYTI